MANSNKKCVLAPQEIFFSDHTQVVRRLEFFELIRVRIEKQFSEVPKKVRNQRFKSRLGWKYRKLIFFHEKVACANGGKFFNGYNQNLHNSVS